MSKHICFAVLFGVANLVDSYILLLIRCLYILVCEDGAYKIVRNKGNIRFLDFSKNSIDTIIKALKFEITSSSLLSIIIPHPSALA